MAKKKKTELSSDKMNINMDGAKKQLFSRISYINEDNETKIADYSDAYGEFVPSNIYADQKNIPTLELCRRSYDDAAMTIDAVHSLIEKNGKTMGISPYMINGVVNRMNSTVRNAFMGDISMECMHLVHQLKMQVINSIVCMIHCGIDNLDVDEGYKDMVHGNIDAFISEYTISIMKDAINNINTFPFHYSNTLSINETLADIAYNEFNNNTRSKRMINSSEGKDNYERLDYISNFIKNALIAPSCETQKLYHDIQIIISSSIHYPKLAAEIMITIDTSGIFMYYHDQLVTIMHYIQGVVNDYTQNTDISRICSEGILKPKKRKDPYYCDDLDDDDDDWY